MTVQVRSSIAGTANLTTSSTTMAIGLPTSLTVGDPLRVEVCSNTGTGANVPAAPSGWVIEQTPTTAGSMSFWSMTRTGGWQTADGSTVNVTISGAAAAQYAYVATAYKTGSYTGFGTPVKTIHGTTADTSSTAPLTGATGGDFVVVELDKMTGRTGDPTVSSGTAVKIASNETTGASSAAAWVGSYTATSGPANQVFTLTASTANAVGYQVPLLGSAPTAAFTDTTASLTVNVSGTGSTAVSPATIASYDWNWGDSTAHGSGSTANHTYAAAGTYTITLTVTDSTGTTNSATASVTVVAATGSGSVASVSVGANWTANSGTQLSAITDSDPTTFITSSSPPSAQELDLVLAAITPPASGQPLKVFLTMDAPLSSTASLSAQLVDSGTTRSSLTNVAIASGSGSSVTNVVTLTFPYSDISAISTNGWNSLTLKLQITAS